MGIWQITGFPHYSNSILQLQASLGLGIYIGCGMQHRQVHRMVPIGPIGSTMTMEL